MSPKVVLVAALLCVGSVWSRPDGAPTIACSEMVPNHGGNTPQTGPAPYTVTLSQAKVEPRADVIVTITADSGVTFRGFFVQARDTSGVPVGMFDPNASAQSIDCLGGTMNAATHVINDNKTMIDIGWTAPSTPTDVTFMVSIVQVFDTFWTGITVPLTVA